MAKPQYERMLSRDDEALAHGMVRLITFQQAAGFSESAIATAERLVALRTKRQGADHYETVNERYYLEHLRKFVKLSKAQQNALLDATLATDEEHVKQGDFFARRLLILQKILDRQREFLGDDHPYTANAFNNVAFHLDAMGQPAAAQLLHERALDIRIRAFGEDHPYIANSYNNLAQNLTVQGKLADALRLGERALAINRRVLGEDHAATANTYNNVAVILDAQKQLARARPYFETALNIRRRVLGENHAHVGDSYNNVGQNLAELGQFAESLVLFRKALELQLKLHGPNHPAAAYTNFNIATSLDILGKFTEAEEIHLRSLETRQRVLGENHADTAAGYFGLAVNQLARSKPADAITTLRSAVSGSEASRLTRALGLERAYVDEANPRLLLAALLQEDQPQEAWDEVEHSLARGQLDHALDANSQLTPEENNERVQAQARLSASQAEAAALALKSTRSAKETARMEHLLNQRRAAEERLAAIAVAASTRRVAAASDIQSQLPADAALVFWVDVYPQGGIVHQHWGCVVRRTGVPHWQRLTGNWQNAEGLYLPQQLRSALAGTASQASIEALARQLRDQRIEPLLAHLAGVKSLYVVPVNIMAGVPVEVLAPEFTISYVPSGTFLTRRDKPIRTDTKILAVGDPVFDAEAVATFTALPPRGLLIEQVVPGGPASKALLKKHDVLVSYAGTDLESAEQLGKLIGAQAKEKPVKIQIWREPIDKLANYEVPPGNLGVVLSETPAREAILARRKSAELIGTLTRRTDWDELPGAEVEVSNLRKLFGQSSVVELTRSQATESRLDELRKQGELAKFRYVHFATHGETNSVRAFDSKLVLSQANARQLISTPGQIDLDNELYASEILEHWKLEADLVTLSACETAIGRDGGGDGLLGFSQAFLLAGSRSVCSSLWKVDDTATVLLMDRFYGNLLGKRADGVKPMGKAAALSEAKHWLRNLTLTGATERLGVLTNGISRGSKKGREVIGEIPRETNSPRGTKPFEHPKYWAAFILIGDPD